MVLKKQYSAAVQAELHALPNDALLRPPEAAAYLNLAASTLAWYRAQRKGPKYVKLGAAVRYRVGALREYAKVEG